MHFFGSSCGKYVFNRIMSDSGLHGASATLAWIADRVPLSLRFDDPYYSALDGLGETRHVFIGGNRLMERWPTEGDFVIAELGFGTGLNFLETTRQWLAGARGDATLSFHSFERFPLTADEISRSIGVWNELSDLGKRLTDAWRPQGTRFEMTIETVELTVHFGDVNRVLPGLDLKADAWYLDGFSPAKNPDMWQSDLLAAVYANTAETGTFATYTAAGWVRRNLEGAGFEVTKVPGFGSKRDMCVGQKPSAHPKQEEA